MPRDGISTNAKKGNNMEVIGKPSSFTGTVTASVHNMEKAREQFVKQFPQATIVLIHQPNTTIDEYVGFCEH